MVGVSRILPIAAPRHTGRVRDQLTADPLLAVGPERLKTAAAHHGP
jgi:hypothetical protein